MSQQQTVRITTTSSSSSSAPIINTGYLKTWPGLLKIAEFILGCISTGIIARHFNDRHNSLSSELFFYLMVVTFLICTTILLISCLFSWSTGGIISKTIYELIYHSVAAVLILAASIVLIVALNDSNYYYRNVYNQLMTASVVGVINGILYLISAYFAQKSYKGI